MGKKTTPPNVPAAKPEGAAVPVVAAGATDVTGSATAAPPSMAALAAAVLETVLPGATADAAGSATDTVGDAADADKAVAGTTPTADPSGTLRAYFVRSVPIRHNDRVYGPGFEIDLTDAEAVRLGGMVTAARNFDTE